MVEIQISENLEIAEPELARTDTRESLIALLGRAADETLSWAASEPQAELTVVLSDDAQLQDLNRQFLGIDAPTDVLSFPGGDTDPDSESVYLGDVILSYPRALAQAKAGGHALEDELQLLTVHGILHLLGHDHADEAEKKAMWEAQAQVLEALGCSLRL